MTPTLLKTQVIPLNQFTTTIRYAEMGNKENPTILLLHGVPENLHAWYLVAPELAHDYHVLAIDWPGFGGSEPFQNHEDYNAINFAAVAIDFLDTLSIEKAHVMATDIGLLPALIMGLDYPERILDLVIMDGIPFPTTQYSSWELKSFQKKGSIRAKALIEWFPKISALIAYNKGFYKGHKIPQAILNEFLADGYNTSNQTAFLSYFQNFSKGQRYFDENAHKMLKNTLVVWGQHDRFIDVQLAYEIAERLPQAALQVIPKSGHYLHMDQPKFLISAAKQFLAANAQESKFHAKKEMVV